MNAPSNIIGGCLVLPQLEQPITTAKYSKNSAHPAKSLKHVWRESPIEHTIPDAVNQNTADNAQLKVILWWTHLIIYNNCTKILPNSKKKHSKRSETAHSHSSTHFRIVYTSYLRFHHEFYTSLLFTNE